MNDDANSDEDVFVRDIQANTTILVSVNATGTGSGKGASFSPVISADGRYVAFESTASDLVANGPTDGLARIYVRDLVNGTTTLASVGPTRSTIEGESPSLYQNGSLVAFTSNPGAGAPSQIYVRNLTTGVATLVSANQAGSGAGNQRSFSPVISGNGRYVAFQSVATNIAPGTYDGTTINLFIRSLAQGVTTLVSGDDLGTGGLHTQSVGTSLNNVSVSADGSTVVYTSGFVDLVPADGNNANDVFAFPQTVAGTGSIQGVVFNDANGDGALDDGETGLSGWTVFRHLQHDGKLDPGDPSIVTQSDGSYSFTGLAAGSYTVDEVLQAGYQQTAPAAPGTMSVTLSAGQTASNEDFGDQQTTPDLAVEPFAAPASGQAGQPAPISFTVVNNGSATAVGAWQDAVYLSPTPTLAPASTLAAVVPHTGHVAPGATYQVDLSRVNLPIVPAGNYYIVVQLVRRNQVIESPAVKGDEKAASTSTMTLGIPSLSVGEPTTGGFTAAGQDLLINVASSASDGSIEVSVQFGALLAPGADAADSSGVFGPSQQLAISPTQAGTYYIDINGQYGNAAAASFTITASTPSIALLGASPSTVGAGVATLAIQGASVGPGTTFAVIGPSGPINATSVIYQGGSSASATFDLSSLPPGVYNLVATDSGGDSTTLDSAVTVDSAVTG